MCDKSKILCDDIDCKICHNKSFKSIEYSKYIVDETIDTRFLNFQIKN